MPLPGCLETWDQVADRILRADEVMLPLVVREAQDRYDRIEDEVEKRKAGVYLKIMRKVEKEGIEFVPKERERTKKMLEDGKIHEDKKKELRERLNVLTSFATHEEKAADIKPGPKEEL